MCGVSAFESTPWAKCWVYDSSSLAIWPSLSLFFWRQMRHSLVLHYKLKKYLHCTHQNCFNEKNAFKETNPTNTDQRPSLNWTRWSWSAVTVCVDWGSHNNCWENSSERVTNFISPTFVMKQQFHRWNLNYGKIQDFWNYNTTSDHFGKLVARLSVSTISSCLNTSHHMFLLFVAVFPPDLAKTSRLS